ncbi:hypothetical protein FB451DRAFT_330979 [Mycena latifolia]|nr:hypothetical protein FB451DRAFT_330979 [Mycena latifolia]
MVFKRLSLRNKSNTPAFCCNCSSETAILAMNTFPAGTRVFYWAGGGQAVYGVVQRTTRGADGTVYVVISTGPNQSVTLPAVAVHIVT